MKAIVSGIGFLVCGLAVDIMLERLGAELPFWALAVLFAIGLALIIYGVIPSRVKNWTKEKVGLILPSGYKSLDEPSVFIRIIKRFRNKG